MDRLGPVEARPRFREILTSGDLIFSRHALEEMEDDDLTELDVVNVVRGGSIYEPEFENGSWRYRVATQNMTVVVAFRSEMALVVVTAWRNKRGVKR